MLAHARVLGYVFNPVSVFWCHHRDGTPAGVVAEVHNTYGERHCYWLEPDAGGRASADKAFYVSPFQPDEGRYRMRFTAPGDKVDVQIVLHDDDGPLLTARMRGLRRPLRTRTLLRMVARRPFVPQRVSASIRRHGVALWLRRVPVTPRKPHRHQERVR